MITIKATQAKNIKEKVTGLIGKRKPQNFILKTHFGIHTIGVKFPIDVLILDSNNKVVTLKEYIKTNSIFFWNPKYEIVVECAAGFIKKNKIKKENKIQLNT